MATSLLSASECCSASSSCKGLGCGQQVPTQGSPCKHHSFWPLPKKRVRRECGSYIWSPNPEPGMGDACSRVSATGWPGNPRGGWKVQAPPGGGPGATPRESHSSVMLPALTASSLCGSLLALPGLPEPTRLSDHLSSKIWDKNHRKSNHS